jgi:hypothetical protein
MSFDSFPSSIAGAAQQVGSEFGQLGSLQNLGQKIGGALNNLSDPSKLLSQIRSINLPAGGDAIGKIFKSSATFGGSDANSDWRVRLTVPGNTIFDSSPIFSPLKAAGGLVFPYTPSINIGSSAKYDAITPVHNNYPFQAYQNSTPDQITITAPFLVENSAEAQYWIATVHFLRAVTKMFTGDSTPAGNPPPILSLNGYGEYVFKNVPVVVTNFSVQLDGASDYISTVSANNSGSLGGLLSNIPALQGAAQKVQSVVGMSAGALLSGGGSSFGGATATPSSHVPTKSQFSITLQPSYSRESVRTFSLNKFVNGDYMTSSGAGYI